MSFEIYNEQPQFKALLEQLPSSLRTQLQISKIITRVHKALLDLGLLSMTAQQERAMDALLKSSSAEFDALESASISSMILLTIQLNTLTFFSGWDSLYIAAARLDLTGMHFYKSAETLDLQSTMLIFNTTAEFLEKLRDLDKNQRLHCRCNRYFMMSTLISLASMARVLKGQFAAFMDQARAYTLYDSGLRFIRASSVQKMDFGDRASFVAEQMWKSKKVFRNPDGSINTTLRVRNRLSGAPLHDALRCWKEEFFSPDFMFSTSGLGMEAGKIFHEMSANFVA